MSNGREGDTVISTRNLRALEGIQKNGGIGTPYNWIRSNVSYSTMCSIHRFVFVGQCCEVAGIIAKMSLKEERFLSGIFKRINVVKT